MGITLSHDGVSLLRGPLALHAPAPTTPPPRIEAGPRVGITRAETLPLRFLDPDSAATSPFRAGRRRKGGAAKNRPPTR
jgi:3-methyladenine DNA glycosylase Mpg